MNTAPSQSSSRVLLHEIETLQSKVSSSMQAIIYNQEQILIKQAELMRLFSNITETPTTQQHTPTPTAETDGYARFLAMRRDPADEDEEEDTWRGCQEGEIHADRQEKADEGEPAGVGSGVCAQ